MIVETLEFVRSEMLTQDKRGTAYPIFIVVEDKKVYGIDSDFADGRDRKDPDSGSDHALCEECEKSYAEVGTYPEHCDECPDESFVGYRIEKDVPNLRAGFFFTAYACKAHIGGNRHHYNETARSYAISAIHNAELKAVMGALVGGEEAARTLTQ